LFDDGGCGGVLAQRIEQYRSGPDLTDLLIRDVKLEHRKIIPLRIQVANRAMATMLAQAELRS